MAITQTGVLHLLNSMFKSNTIATIAINSCFLSKQNELRICETKSISSLNSSGQRQEELLMTTLKSRV